MYILFDVCSLFWLIDSSYAVPKTLVLSVYFLFAVVFSEEEDSDGETGRASEILES
jgi:hypothetical protein